MSDTTVGLTAFVARQIAVGFAGTRLESMKQLIAIRTIAEDYMNNPYKPGLVYEGYAPFVKVVKIFPAHPNVLDALGSIKCPIVRVNDTNRGLLVSKYKARREGELPVLSRWFPASGPFKCVDPQRIEVILYSKNQLVEEGNDFSGADWDIVSVNAELKPSAPMLPMTMLRNALGKEHGGSGTAIDAEEYQRAVEFWEAHAMIG